MHKPIKVATENYCCFCGSSLGTKKLYDGSTEKYCIKCDYVFFPALTPAIITLVTFGEHILLSRSVGWQHPYWGFIAGHIQPQESAEEAVVREVMEEVGLQIDRPQFITTYPHQTDRHVLMLAYRAEAKTQTIKLSEELTAAQWFKSTEALPIRPGSMIDTIVQSISGRS